MANKRIRQFAQAAGKGFKEKPKTTKVGMKFKRGVEKKENWVARLKRKVIAQLKRDKETVRTKTVTGQLQRAGLTEKDIKKLRGKK